MNWSIRNLFPRITVILIVMIYTVASISLITLARRSDITRQGEILITRVHAQLNRLSLLEWQSMAERAVDQDILRQVADTRNAFLQAMNSLTTLGEGIDKKPQIIAAWDTYNTWLDKELHFIGAGDINQAKTLDEDHVDPAFGNLDRILTDIEVDLLNHGNNMRKTIILGAIGLILGSGLLIGLLIVKNQRTIVAMEVLNAEQRALKRSEEALRESEDRYRAVVEDQTEIICRFKPDGTYVFANETYCRFFGKFNDELLGRQWFPEAHPEDIEMIQEKLKTMSPSNPIIMIENRVYSKKGDLHCMQFINRGFYNQQGTLLEIQSVGRDITDRKRAEEEKRSLEERLQRSEKMESLGTLAGGVAHDLNNVLGVVVGYSEMLLDSVDKSSPLRHGLENVMNGGLMAAAIVDDLLTLARRGVQGRTILNLNNIIADCQKSPEFANLSSHHPAVTIKTDLETDLLNISGSAVHLGKSLYNMISNASEAMPYGGTVTIKTTNQYLDKPIQGYDQVRQGDYVAISVSDTGEGISENDMIRIFEPFYTKKIMGRSGTGLGLAVVWGTVKDHNGYINMQSEEGKGSTLTLYFPVTREDITTEAVAAAISEYMGNGESILVLDDVKEQRDLAASMLKTLNYNVSSVSSGEEAVAYLKEHEVDLMVLDMIMDPGMDGLDTYKQVIKIRPTQKSIIVSGFSESDRVQIAKGLGAGAYLKKPYIKEKLGLAVRKELDRK